MTGVVHGAGHTDTGMVREHNEDSILVAAPVFVVADGVGGAEAGEVASGIAVDVVSDAVDELIASARGPVEGLSALVNSTVQAAHHRIRDYQQDGNGRPGMATTMTMAVVTGDGTVVMGHVGDSRAYRVTGGAIEQVTDDHSLVGELVRSGRITEDEARHHPQGNVITQALGSTEVVTVDTPTTQLRAGEWLVLCSDGLSGMVDDEAIGETVRSAASPEAAGNTLIQMANQAGGTDNISVIVVAGEAHHEAAVDEHPTADDLGRVQRAGNADAQRTASTPFWKQGWGVWALAGLALATMVVVAVVWNQSYYIDELDDGTVGIRQGFPVLGANTVYATSDVQVDELSSFDVDEIVASHTLRGRDNAEQMLSELVEKRLPVEPDGGIGDGAEELPALGGTDADAPQGEAAPQDATVDQ